MPVRKTPTPMPSPTTSGQGRLATSQHIASDVGAQKIVRLRLCRMSCRVASCPVVCSVFLSISRQKAQAHLRTLTAAGCLPAADELQAWLTDQTWKPLMRCIEHDEAQHGVLGCCVFDGSSKALTCHETGQIRAWNVQTGSLLYTIEAHAEVCVNAITTIERDGRTLALSCGADGTFKLWDLHGPDPGAIGCVYTRLVCDDARNRDVTHCAAIEFKGRWRVLTCSADTAMLWTLPEGELAELEATQPVFLKGHKGDVLTGSIFVCSEGKLQALTGSKDNLLKLWDLEISDGKDARRRDQVAAAAPRNLKGHTGVIYGCAVSADKTKALSCSGDRTIKLWELTKQICLRTLVDSGQVNDCTFIGRTHAVTGSNSCTTIWDLTSGEAVRKLYGHENVKVCLPYDDDTRLITCSLSAVIVLDLSASTCSKLRLDEDTHPMDAVWSLVDLDSDGHLNLDEIRPILQMMGRGKMHNGKMTLTDDLVEQVRRELDKGGDGLITTHEFEEWYVQQPERNVKRGHGSVVKEITQFPDPQNTNVLSCSYDGSVKVWCMKTGDILMTLEEAHGEKTEVFEVCGFPDNVQIMTCGGDATVKVWDWKLGKCNATLKGHTAKSNPVRGCGVFTCGKKAFSCSKNGEIKIWQLTLGKDGTMVTGGSMLLSLDGHTDLVDRCCLYDDDTRLISASWDKTLRVWDAKTGKEIFKLKDHNKVRGVSVYAEGKRAASTGSGLTLSIWDLEKGTLVKRLDTGHTATVWGLEVIDDREVPQADGAPAKKPMAITWSNDKTIKIWSLEEGMECEIVAARRQVEPAPMCVSVIPGSFNFGSFPMIVGGFRSIQLVDISNIGTGPSSGVLWSGFSNHWAAGGAEMQAWSKWLLDLIEEGSPHFMFARQRNDDLPTMVHKLAAQKEGHVLLSTILDTYKESRKSFIQGSTGGLGKQQRGAATIGLMSRAGLSETTGNALSVATEAKNVEVVDILLKDYCDHISCFKWKIERNAPVTSVLDVTEDDVRLLFKNFPHLACNFLIDLPMRRTDLASADARCDFFDASNATIIVPSDYECDVLSSRDGESFWRKVLAERWKRSKMRNKDTDSIDTDSAWGVKVQSFVLPISAGGTLKTISTIDCADDSASSSEAPAKFQDGYEALAASVERSALLGQTVDPAEGASPAPARQYSSAPAFTGLLEAAVEYAQEHDDPDIFLSPALQHIVQFKWEGRCHVMYKVLFCAYCIYIVILTWVTLYFDSWRQFDVGSSPPEDTMDTWTQTKRVAVWSGYGFVLVYTIALIKHELHQLIDAKLQYFMDPYNIIDFGGASLAMYNLGSMVTIDGGEHSDDQMHLDVVQAQMMIFTWFKVLYYLRGIDETAFLVKCLVQILADIKYFLLVLALILIAFGVSFYLLLRLDDDDQNFTSLPMSFVSVYDIMFGAFEVTWFRSAPKLAMIAIIDFMLFMLVVPTIMLNALIAIMSDTYAKTQQRALQTNFLERANIILEFEKQMVYKKGAPLPRKNMLSFIFRTLLSLQIEFPDYPFNLHLLQPKTEDGEVEDATMAAVNNLEGAVSAMKEKLDALDQGQKTTEQAMEKLTDKMDAILELLRSTS